MSAWKAYHRFLRRHLFLLAGVVLLACVMLITYARSSKKSVSPYALAADVPRGALVYAQFSDLPALTKRWDESKLKEQYLASTNFQQFQSRHLALKLIERWQEFNDAVGFPLDALAVSGASENKAVLAVYDFGRLEMVFVAPISEEKLAATKFFQSTNQFEETKLPDGTVYYSRDVAAEGGRRQQKFAFASARGRIVLATSEQLLLRTLSNINNKPNRDSLSDDPSFKNLSAEAKPHFLTVWMDQTKLNNDWYFKHYWLMRNVEQLKNIRACLLDLELQDGKWIEHRDFLLYGQAPEKSSVIPSLAAHRILSFVPDNAPYIKVRALDEAESAATIVRDTFMDRQSKEGQSRRERSWNWQSYDNSDFYPDGAAEEWGDDSYHSLDPRFDSLIDDPVDAKVEDEDEAADASLRQETQRRAIENLLDTLSPARPVYAATIESPQEFNGPLFAEFRRGAVITLQSPNDFHLSAFESAVNDLAESRLMIAGSHARLNWTDASCGAERCRELQLPMLGWGMSYALRGSDLILANGSEMLQAMLRGDNASRAFDPKSSLAVHDLTVIRLNQRAQAFDSLMQKLDAPRVKAYWAERQKGEQGNEDAPSQEFFSGNISSLLDLASPVQEIRIKRNLQPTHLREEVEFIFK
jgi:hypothetical protein